MSVVSQPQQLVNKLVSELKARESRNRAAKELYVYVSAELREVSADDDLNAFLDVLVKKVLELVKSQDPASKLGGVMAIVALINADACNANDRISRFGNYLRNNCMPPNTTDVAVIELASKAIARLTQVSGTYTANLKFELINNEMNRAFELLGGERNEGKQYAAVLILREIAFSMPTFFYQNVSRFFEVIFYAIWDPKLMLREAAVNALRAGLVVTAQRETSKQSSRLNQQQQQDYHTDWYNLCFEEAMEGFEGLSQDLQERGIKWEDRLHGSIMVLSELLRCANSEWERTSREIEENILKDEAASTNGKASSSVASFYFSSSSNEQQRRRSGSGGFRVVRRYYQSGFRGRSGSLTTSSATSAATGSAVSVSPQIPFSWLGTVPVGREPVVGSNCCRRRMQGNFERVCDRALLLTRWPLVAKNANIQHGLMVLLPKLAAFDRETFARSFLEPTMQFMDKLLLEKNRYAFVSIGLLAVAVGSEIQSHLRNVLTQIKMGLPTPKTDIHGGVSGGGKKSRSDKNKSASADAALLACVSMLARAVGQNIKPDVAGMLDAMLSVELSTSLTTALHELATYIPAFKKQIAEGLLKILSLILMQQPFMHPGTPKRLLLSPNHSDAVTVSGTPPPPPAPPTSSEPPPSTSRIVLALRTLGTFDFEGHSLLVFMRHCADHYLHSEEKPIRLEAVRTCAALLEGTLLSSIGQKSQTAVATINEVLSKLLVVGITDQESEVRLCVLNAMLHAADKCFDYHLAQAENLSALFVSLNDEVFEIREKTICIIGRLAILNPAYIMPSLRKTLIELLTEMEFSGAGRNKEQSARMLGHLVAHAPVLIRPYVEPILKVLIPKLREPDLSPMVTTSVLSAVGDLALVGGVLMRNYVDELLPLLLDILNDASSSHKREVSLWTLSQLVESTGCVTEPYARYPQLLDTLLGFLRTEQRAAIRSQTLRLLGLLGALDPYRHKMNTGQIDSAVGVTTAPLIPITDPAIELEQCWEMSPSELLVNMGSSSSLEEFYPSVAVATLMKIIRDPTLSHHHTEVVQAVTYIFRALGIKSVPYIAQVFPSLINMVRTSDPKFHENLFRQMGILIGIVRQHIRNYLPDIFALIKDFWRVDSPLQPTIIGLVENISEALGSEFKIYLPHLVPQMLRVLSYDSSENRSVTKHLLLVLRRFGGTLSDYVHLLLPKIVIFFDFIEAPFAVRKTALECVEALSESIDLSEYASLILHPLTRCLDKSPDLRPPAMDCLSAVVAQLGKKYVIFVPMVQKVLLRHKINHQRYDILCARVLEGGDFDENSYTRRTRRRNTHLFPELAPQQSSEQQQSSLSSVQRLRKSANINNLQEAWAVSRRVSKDDWLDWYGRLCSEFLKASPSPALRACWTVAQRHLQLAKDLFNASFVSCWTELDAVQQDELMASLEQALTVQDLPEISQTVLNLAEFMEHCDKGPLPLDPVLLGEQAVRSRAYAKALHYKEDEFMRKPSVPVLESLISINNKLGQKEAAAGLLEWGRKNLPGDLKVQERWYEKLHDWEKALQVYQEKSASDPDNPELVLGRMRCYESLGEWGDLHAIAERHWPVASDETKHRMARMAASASWGRQEWEAMARYTDLLPRESQDGAFYRAVLCVHKGRWEEAQELIDLTRSLLDNEVTALSLESYQRAYPTMVSVQLLAELEEVIEYLILPERQEAIREMWRRRLQGCQRVVEDWQRIMHVRSLVISPQTDQRTWLKYASLCRKSGRLSLSHRTLVNILGVDPSANAGAGAGAAALPTSQPRAAFAYCKHLWAAEERGAAFNQLHTLVKRFVQPKTAQLMQQLQQVQVTPEESVQRDRQLAEMKHLLARCYHKLGQWQESLQSINEKSIGPVRDYYAAATEHDSVWYKAWHSFAVVNFEAVLFYKHQQQRAKQAEGQQQQQQVSPVNFISEFAVPSMKGFVRSIALSKGSSLQDTLRLLTLLFDYGHQPDMYEALHEGIRTVAIDNWLQVIPQLIARIDTPRPLVSRLIHQVLTDLGKFHPQAIVYSLTVAAKSNNPARRAAANKILNKVREHNDTLVSQALLVSDELIRVAILWHEQWHEGLEEASRLYFGERNNQGMLAVLRPLHALLERGPQTMKETSFQQAYGTDLNDAKRWCERYENSLNTRDLNQAWDLYYQVFRRISRQLPKLTQLEMHYVSPKLLMCRDLELAVPGSYVPNREVIRIEQVQPSLQVITSKQRPRKLSMKGSNGRNYMFLLKGHEDLRQDERVMQFFSLVNSLLTSDAETFRRNLAIQRFAVIPLSTNSGLIGWVPHSDTLHGLIKDYREKKKILLNIEHKIMQKMTPNVDHLPLMNKVEVFEHSLEHTQGDDLARILFLKAPSSEVWFDRRTNFTRSLAVMSMVGYVLGLGDRHPSNLLLDRMSGKILHIDFGDCFEVAMTREKFPEKIPFRLTRMLINAMEVTGIEGTYRSTCESVMRVLKLNKDSLMAVLEAFVYDPLLNWRLIETGPKAKKSKSETAAAGNVGGEAAVGGAATAAEDSLSAEAATLGESPTNGGNNKKPDEPLKEPQPPLLKEQPPGDLAEQPEILNKKALDIIQRVRDKLTGRDFSHDEELDIAEQVDRLIEQATNNENLCQSYIGWCPFW